MSYNEALNEKSKLIISYNNFKNFVNKDQTQNKLNLTTKNKLQSILNLLQIVISSVEYYSSQSKLNNNDIIIAYINYCKFYIIILNRLFIRVNDLVNLSADCSNVTDYKVYVSLENGIKKLMRGSPTKSECQFTLLEDLGQSPSTSFDPVTQKITTEIILKSLNLGSLSLPYSDEDKRTIKEFISGIAGLDTGIITGIKMLNTNDNDNLVAQISFDTSFTNTIPGTYSLPIKSGYSVIQPKSAEITVRLIDANIVLPSRFSGDFNVSYLQDIAKYSKVFK